MENLSSSEIIISERDFNLIYSKIGAPLVAREDIEISADDIKEYIILPTIMKYYTYHPIITKESISVNNTMLTADYPTPEIYGVGGVQVAKYNNTISPTMAGMPMVGYNVFNTSAMINTNTNRGYGTRYGLSSNMSSFTTDKATNDAFANVFQIKHFRDIQDKRQIEIYSNMPGIIEVTYCGVSYNVNDVPFQRKVDFLDYAGSMLVLHLASLREMIDGDFPTEIKMDALVDRANARIEKIEEKWELSSNAVVIR